MKLRWLQERLLSLVSAASGISAATTRERLKCAYQSDVESRATQAFNLSASKHEKRILCVEVGGGHDVIRPSVYHVLHTLGYEIDTVLYGESVESRWDFFSATPYLQRQELIANEYEMLVLLNSDIIHEYDFIFFNTNFVYTKNRFDSGYDYIQLLDFLHIPIKSKYGCLTIAPHPQGYKEWSLRTTCFNHLGIHDTKIFSCDYFGDNEQIGRKKENLFLVSGNINSNQKNHSMVFDAVRKLLDKGVSNFKVLINGDGHLNVPNDLKSVLVFLSENRPPELFSILTRVNFIISGFDSSVKWQRDAYGHGTCSAAFMYSLGFLKPYILENFFTGAFQLTNATAIIYEHGMLAAAMERAISMTDEEYDDMRRQIRKERDKRRSISIQTVFDATKQQATLKHQPFLFLNTKILFILKVIKYSRLALKFKFDNRLKDTAI